MARLIDLNPRWFAAEGRRGQGLTFDCPCCRGTQRATRLGVAFSPTLDGGTPIDLQPRTMWPLLGSDTVPPGIHWQRSGDTFDALTLSPSVDASGSGHWHGWIQNGEVR